MTTEEATPYKVRTFDRYKREGSPSDDFECILRLAFPNAELPASLYRFNIGNVELSYSSTRSWQLSLRSVDLTASAGDKIRRAVKVKKDGTISITDIRAKHAALEAWYAEHISPYKEAQEREQQSQQKLQTLKQEMGVSYLLNWKEAGDENVILWYDRYHKEMFKLELSDLTEAKVRQIMAAYKQPLV